MSAADSWLASLLPGGVEDSDGLHGGDSVEEAKPAENAWLASLSAPDAQNDEEASVESGPAELNDAAVWLEEMGFGSAAVQAALQEASGDADEALRLLQQGSTADEGEEEEADEEDGGSAEGRIAGGSTLHPAKRQKRAADGNDGLLDMDGFQCRAQGSRLVLHLPGVGLDGPEVGRIKADGSMVFRGVNEWSQELYYSRRLRANPGGLGMGFDAAEVAGLLEAGAPWAWARFASAEEVRTAHAEMEALNADGTLSAASASTTAVVKARSDKVAFLNVRGGAPACPPGCLRLFQRLEAAAAALGWPKNGCLLMPRLGMASIYDSRGTRYEAHRDNERDSKGRWLNHRGLTAIVYVNPTGFECAEDGGHLRCHVGAAADDLVGSTATRVEDIAPRGGTAVLFPAKNLLHEVLPCHRRRYALTLWLLEVPDLADAARAADGERLGP